MEAQLLNNKGAEVGKVDLRDAIFGRPASREFLHEYVTTYQANQRRGTANTKTRSEVSGSGKKPWKQKHTGRARAGSFRSPLWRHGGVTFGPRAGHVHLDFPRRKARLALAHALSAKHAQGGIVFVDSLSLENAKTKLVAQILKSLKCEGRTMLVLDAPDAKLALASRNIPELELALAGDINAYGVLRCRRMVVTRTALEKLTTRCVSLAGAESLPSSAEVKAQAKTQAKAQARPKRTPRQGD
ncbi:MAG TPA: 50S ribosomal protein L4 [Elusimicrobia bacterium]|nr:50S ribosomal protein L4 [Elusimicrobiota bacterium]HBT62412.1 50S ribosomal protein L4 [Elusimicrobiota bacterium]